MKAQDYEKIMMLNQETEKVIFENEVIWENKWWEKATNIANPRLRYESFNDAYFYANKILLNNKNINQVYVKWNESALYNLNKIDNKISDISPAFYTSNNGKVGDYIASINQSIDKNNGTNEVIPNIKKNDLIKVLELNKTEWLIETYCESMIQINFWVYNKALGKDLNRINNIIGLVISVK